MGVDEVSGADLVAGVMLGSGEIDVELIGDGAGDGWVMLWLSDFGKVRL